VVKPLVVTVGVKPGAELFHELLTGQGIDCEHIPMPGKLNFKAVAWLRRILIRRRIEILHTHGMKSDIMGHLATRGTPVKLVATPHGWSADEGLRIRIYEMMSRAFLRSFDRIYPLSPALLHDLRRRGFDEQRLKLILNAVDTAAFELCFQSRRPRRPADPFNILFVGRLFRPKGVFELLEAFAGMKVDCPVELRFVGGGPEHAALASRCSDLGLDTKVRFVGEVHDVGPHLIWSSVLALPSYSEGIPRAVMEAFCAGVPVIGTSIPGIRALITDGMNGLLVPVGDSASLSRALELIASHPERAQCMAENARQHVLNHHSAERQAREFEQEYQSLLAGTLRTATGADSAEH
jgi:glycosyltransferase involved in cell wall biosynthesis